MSSHHFNDINQFTITGQLVGEPERVEFNDGSFVVNLNIGMRSVGKNDEGSWQAGITKSVVTVGTRAYLANWCAKNLVAEDRLTITGNIKSTRRKTNNGAEFWAIRLNADCVWPAGGEPKDNNKETNDE